MRIVWIDPNFFLSLSKLHPNRRCSAILPFVVTTAKTMKSLARCSKPVCSERYFCSTWCWSALSYDGWLSGMGKKWSTPKFLSRPNTGIGAIVSTFLIIWKEQVVQIFVLLSKNQFAIGGDPCLSLCVWNRSGRLPPGLANQDLGSSDFQVLNLFYEPFKIWK